jgi:hypothetical protein
MFKILLDDSLPPDTLVLVSPGAAEAETEEELRKRIVVVTNFKSE